MKVFHARMQGKPSEKRTETFTGEVWGDPVIGALQDRVVLDPSPPPVPDRFVHRHGGTVTIRRKDGSEISRSCKAPRGSGPRGVEWADVDAKYRRLVPLAGLSAERTEASLDLIHTLERRAKVADLTALIAAAG